jgi:hypothetical protein
MTRPLDSHDWKDIDFGLECSSIGDIFIIEQGVFKLNPGPRYTRGDRLAVRVQGDTVSYYHNGGCIYVSQQKPDFPLVVKSGFYGTGGKAEEVQLET